MAVTPFAPKGNFNSQEFNSRIEEMNTDVEAVVKDTETVTKKAEDIELAVGELNQTVSDLGENVKKKTEIFGPTTVSVPVASWSGTGPWTQTIAVSGVLSTDTAIGIYPVDIADNTQRKAYKEAYSCLAVEAQTVNNGIVLTCRDAKPTITFNIIVKGVR